MNSNAETKSFGRDHLSIIAIGLIILALVIRISNALLFDLSGQHDPGVHLRILSQWENGDSIHSYNSPVYLEWYSIHRMIICPFRWFISDSKNEMQLYVGLANFHLMLLLLGGLFRLGVKLGLSPRQILFWLALSSAMPPVQRSLSMVRPENIQLAASPWLLLAAINWFQEARGTGSLALSSNFFIFHLLGATMLFQKPGAIAVLIPAYIAQLFLRPINKRNMHNLLISVITLTILTVAFVGTWFAMSGNIFFNHHAAWDPQYANHAPASFFTFPPVGKLLLSPFRDELRSSMLSILIADLFGDYWRYGYNHSQFTPSPGNDSLMLFRQRFGAMISILLIATLALAVAYGWKLCRMGNANVKELVRILIIGTLPLLLGLLYLAAVSQTQFNPQKGDIAKWEYISFVIPFLYLPVVYCSSWLRARLIAAIYYGLCLVFIVVGLAQSVFVPIR